MSRYSYRITIVALIVIICGVIGHFHFASLSKIGDIYQSEIEKTIINIKKSFLKNTVDNLIHEIETARNAEVEYYKRIVNRRYDALTYDTHLSDDEFIDYFIRRFRFDPDIDIGFDYWTVLLWNRTDNTVLYDPAQVFRTDIATTLAVLDDELSYYRIIEHGTVSGLIGVSKEYIDDLTKAKMADKIRGLRFDHDSYIWVNGVLDYGGGPNYAIRVVHPNLPETEGMYLSTDMTDIAGNLPYLAELEGVKENGELFFNYYFKRLHSDEVAEKLTYAKLYKDYDWIIAMGIHIDDVNEYIVQTNQKSSELAYSLLLRLVVILLLIVAFFLILLILVEKLHFRQTKKQMELEINKDSLTKAWSRRSGTKDLTKAFKDFQVYGVSPAVMMFDVDNFKRINDAYGHEVGDQILKDVVRVVSQAIGNSHKLIRWGGDEFVGILVGLEKNDVERFGERICQAVSSLKIPVGSEVISPTLSIGFSYFKKTDRDFMDVLRRADKAMYRAKADGRNKANLL